MIKLGYRLDSLQLLPQVALKVGMSCQGCVGAVDRVLKKMPGESLISTEVSAYEGAPVHLITA